MGRPRKQTVDYFPHFVSTDSRTKFILEQSWGNDGYAFWFKLLELLGRSEGHYYDCSATANEKYLVALMKLDKDTISEILEVLADLGNIDKELWEERKVIWCQSLVDNLQHKYLFLTKNPKRYADLDWADKLPIRDNMWYGTSVTNGAQMEQAADAFGEMSGKAKTFFSIEPILEDIVASKGWAIADNGSYAKWIILGAETGRRKEKVTPEREWIKKITDDCDEGGIPLFMKDSLIPIVGEDDMRRELPRELRRTP